MDHVVDIIFFTVLEWRAHVCNHGLERWDFCAEMMMMIIIITQAMMMMIIVMMMRNSK